MRKKVLPLSGPKIGGANDPIGPLGSAGPGVALRTKKKKITSLSFGVSIVYFKVYGRYQFQFNKIGGPQDTHVKPGGPVKQNRNYSKYRISANSFRGNYSFLNLTLCTCDLWTQYIQVRKLFKGGNYSRKYGIWLCWIFGFTRDNCFWLLMQ